MSEPKIAKSRQLAPNTKIIKTQYLCSLALKIVNILKISFIKLQPYSIH